MRLLAFAAAVWLLGAQVLAQTVVTTILAAEPTQEPSFVSDQAFQDAVINSTNTYRSDYNASAVQWNDSLADFASDYVDDCNFAHSVSSAASVAPSSTFLRLIILQKGRAVWREPSGGLPQRDRQRRGMGQRSLAVRFLGRGVRRVDGPLHAAGVEGDDIRRVRAEVLQRAEQRAWVVSFPLWKL